MQSLDVIPGNTLRGLFAQRWFDLGRTADEPAFRDIFLNGRTRFGFATIQGAHIIPLSARSCKYASGFRNIGGHGVTDLLLQSEADVRCTCCAAPLDYCEGFWVPSDQRSKRVRTRLITRTAIDPVRGSASDAKLYNQRVIEEDQTFQAVIEAPAEIADKVSRMIDTPFVARIGTGRSRGQGWVDVERATLPVNDWGEATKRFDLFCAESGRPVLVVTLLSDCIFHDDYLRDCTMPLITELAPLGLNPDDWQSAPTRAFSGSRVVYGFDGEPLHLPRIPRLAVRAGSVFLFEATTVTPALPKGDGIGWVGDQNKEGFGRIILWHPFHLEPELKR